MEESQEGINPSSFLDSVIEAGQCMVQKEFKVSIRDVCKFNEIEEGDIVTIYIKKTNLKSKKRE